MKAMFDFQFASPILEFDVTHFNALGVKEALNLRHSMELRDFDLGYHENTLLLLHHRVRALNLVFSGLGAWKLRQSGYVQIEVTVVAVAHGVGGSNTF